MRAEVTVNGKVAGANRNDAVLVFGPEFPRELIDRIREVIEVGSEWRDGTGTTTLTIAPEEKRPVYDGLARLRPDAKNVLVSGDPEGYEG